MTRLFRSAEGERGSAAVEVVLLAVPVMALVMLVVFAGRVALARQSVEAAAADAARAASLARTVAAATSDATTIARRSLARQGLSCVRSDVVVDTSGFAVPVGQPAWVRVTVSCDVRASDLGLPGTSTVHVEATMSSPLDTFRQRR